MRPVTVRGGKISTTCRIHESRRERLRNRQSLQGACPEGETAAVRQTGPARPQFER